MYLDDQEVLIVKIIPGSIYKVSATLFANLLEQKATMAGGGDNLVEMGGTRFQGIASSKEADMAFKPQSSRPNKTDWPTIVIECGVVENLERLRVDCHWWLANSVGAVKIVLLICVDERNRKIHLEKLETIMASNALPSTTRTTHTQEVDVIGSVATGAPLNFNFENIFLHKPANNQADLVITTKDLEEYGERIWRCAERARKF
ncbi:hypothetical protein HOY80DRAFT_993092 [Tuber brumale]|nr:hypothetical protein HOY80DRAFT_993092 [Tuber brumale]